MASILRVNTLTDASSNNSTTMSVINQGVVKVFVSYKSSSSHSIFNSTNTASLTDNGTGYFTINLTNSMNNNDYSRIGSAGENANSGGNRVVGLRSPSTGSFNLFTCM